VTTLIFMDTETTGLSLDDDIWEFAAIRREADGTETEHHLFIEHDRSKCAELPDSFLADHRARWDESGAVSQLSAANYIHDLALDRPHIVGAVPNFDTERLAKLLARFGKTWSGHYHLIDVENLAVGYLHGLTTVPGYGSGAHLPLPWDSDAISRACGVEPPTDKRHTAMGDAKWARALYDAVTHG
jgi:hypothetical protein